VTVATADLRVTITVDTSRAVQGFARLANVFAQIGQRRVLLGTVVDRKRRHRVRVVTRAKQRRKW
jgi:hypothetical protein